MRHAWGTAVLAIAIASSIPVTAHHSNPLYFDMTNAVTLEGEVELVTDPTRVAEAIAGYGERYGPPGERPDRVAIEIHVDRILGRA